MILVVITAVATSVVVEKVVFGHQEREVALVFEGTGFVDLVVGGRDGVVVDFTSPEFLASAAGCVIEHDLAGLGCCEGGEEGYEGDG